MFSIGAAILVALLIWWASTGVILVLDGLPRRTFVRSMSAATLLLALALYGVFRVRTDSSPTGAYLGFGCAIAIWGWLEMSFLMGYITGPRRHACPAGCRGWRHFGHAIQAILWHELAIIALVLLTFLLTGSGSNRVAAWSMTLLWAMRSSAKLNLFLGVRNLSVELLPANLTYLASFFRRQPLNFLFPVSVTAGTVLVTQLVTPLFSGGLSESGLVGNALLATLAVLGVLEHWLLVLPFSATALWGWGLRSRDPSTRDNPPPCSRRSAA